MKLRQKPQISSYEKVAEKLKKDISGGIFPPGSKLDSVRTLAYVHKCGQPTVVRAIELLVRDGFLISKPRKGTYVTEKDIWKVSPRKARILTGFVTSLSTDIISSVPYLSGMNVLQKKLDDSGIHSSIHGCLFYPPGRIVEGEFNAREYIEPEDLGIEKSDIIITTGIYDVTYLASLNRLGIPVVTYDLDTSAIRMDSVFIDNIGSGFDLTTSLIEEGHKEIAFLASSLNSIDRELCWGYDPCITEREDGYKLAMNSRGLKPKVFNLEWSEDETELMERIFGEAPGATAFVCDRSIKRSLHRTKIAKHHHPQQKTQKKIECWIPSLKTLRPIWMLTP